MRFLRVFAGLIVMALALATPAAAAGEVPITGTVTGQHWIDPEAPGCEPGTADWEFYSTGTGEMTELGMVEYSLRQCTVFNPMEGTASSAGTITFIAADGDMLVVAQRMISQVIGEPNAPPDGFTLEGTWTVQSGTGRFVLASGSGSMDGAGDIPGGVALFDLPDGAAEFNLTGSLAYNAGFVLVNAATDQDVRPLVDGAVVNLATLPEFNIRAEMSGPVGSVAFAITDAHDRPVRFRLDGVNRENVVPYAVGGDWPVGNYLPTLLGPGAYTLTATPYSGGSLTGEAGRPMTLSFLVVDDLSFTAELAGEVTFQLGTPAHLERCGPEPEGPLVLTDSPGVATGLGPVEALWGHCAVGATGAFINGKGTITTTGGDSVSFEYDNPAGESTFTMTVVGGTGIFAGASGTAQITFSVIPQLLPDCAPTAEDPCYDPTVPWPFAATIVVSIG